MVMKQIRDMVMVERQKFLRAFDTYPTQLFVSPSWAAQVTHYFALEQEREPEPVDGKQFFNMVIHVVPTLSHGFYVA